jgi:hypothetical protein
MSKKGINRRKALSTIGASVIGVSALSTSGAAETSEDLREKSLQLRDENNWSVNEWRQYIVSKGAQIKTQDKQFLVPSLASTGDDSGGDDLAPEELDYDQCTLFVTYAYNFYGSTLQYYFDFAWEIEVDDYIIEDTSGPIDLASIGWVDSHYLKDGSVYYGPQCEELTDRDSTSITGAVAGFDVAAAGELAKANNPDASSWTLDSYFQVPVQVVDGSSASERRVEVDYHHRYGVANFQGISWGGGIPSLSFGIGEEQWVREAEPTESQMEDTYVDSI